MTDRTITIPKDMILIPEDVARAWLTKNWGWQPKYGIDEVMRDEVRRALPAPPKPLAVGDQIDMLQSIGGVSQDETVPLVMTIRFMDADVIALRDPTRDELRGWWRETGDPLYRVGETEPAPWPQP